MNASPELEKTEYSKVLTEEQEECKDPPQCEEGWKNFGESEGAGHKVCLKNVGQVCSLTKVHIYYLSRFQIICISRLKWRIFCRRLDTDRKLAGGPTDQLLFKKPYI